MAAGVSEQLHWANPRLSLYSRSGALVLKAEGGAAPTVLSAEQSRLRHDLPLLARGIKKLSGNPILLAVRTPGASVSQRQPEPYVLGVRRGDAFLFYRVPANGGTALQLDYGVPPRWPAAALLSLLLWLVFPLFPALALRHYALSAGALKPDERLRFFDRSQLIARIAAVAGAYATLSVLHPERTAYFGFNPWGAMSPTTGLLFPYWFWCSGIIGLARRKLSWEIAPSGLVVRTNPLLSFGFALGLLGLMVGPGLVMSHRGPRAGLRAIPFFTGAIMVLSGILLLVVFVPRLVWKPKRLLDIPFDDVPHDPEALRTLLRDRIDQTTRELADPQPNPALAKSQAKAMAAAPVARAVMALAVDQQVALSASYHIGLPRYRLLTLWQSSLFVGSTLVMIGSGLWCCLHPSSSTPAFLLLGSIFLMFACTTAATAAMQRRVTRISADADARVAQSLDDPRRLLDALRQLEEAESAMYAALGTHRPRAAGFTERRKRLEQHLGLG